MPGNKNQKYYLISGNENVNIQPQETKPFGRERLDLSRSALSSQPKGSSTCLKAERATRLQNYSLHTLFDEGCIEINLLFFSMRSSFSHRGGKTHVYSLCLRVLVEVGGSWFTLLNAISFLFNRGVLVPT